MRLYQPGRARGQAAAEVQVQRLHVVAVGLLQRAGLLLLGRKKEEGSRGVDNCTGKLEV